MDLDLGCVDVPEFLTMLGVDRFTVEDNEARYSCPYPAHGYGDKNPSAYMNLDTTAFICFSCGAKGNAITFLADIKEVPRLVAKNWIAQKWAPHYADIDDLQAYVRGMFEKVVADEVAEEWEPLPESEYEKRIVDWEELYSQWNFKGGVPGWAAYMFERGFDSLTLNLWDVCYDEISDRPCITVRSSDGQLVGFKGRAWRESQQPKYMVLGDTDRNGQPYGFKPYDASKHVFGIHMLGNPEGDGVVCIEGELSVISSYQKGVTNPLGPSGSSLSDKQVSDIVALTDTVTLLFDTDNQNPQQYMTAKLKLLSAIRAFERYIEVRVCDDHDVDPAEMESAQLDGLVKLARSSTEWRLLQVVT